MLIRLLVEVAGGDRAFVIVVVMAAVDVMATHTQAGHPEESIIL